MPANEVEKVCVLVADAVENGEELEDVLRALLPYTNGDRRAVVVDAESLCGVLAASDPKWARAHLLLRHALSTGLFTTRVR